MRMHCAKTAEPIGTNFGMIVAPDENSSTLKFGDDRFRGWGTVPPNDPQNGQIRAFSCTVAKRVIRLWQFSAEWWSRQGNIALKRSDDRLGYSAPKCCPQMVKFTLFHAFFMQCTQTRDSFATTFGKDVGRGQVGKPLKFGDYRSRNWGTVPPNMPQNGQIRAFLCTVAKCVIRLQLFLARRFSSTMRTSC